MTAAHAEGVGARSTAELAPKSFRRMSATDVSLPRVHVSKPSSLRAKEWLGRVPCLGLVALLLFATACESSDAGNGRADSQAMGGDSATGGKNGDGTGGDSSDGDGTGGTGTVEGTGGTGTGGDGTGGIGSGGEGTGGEGMGGGVAGCDEGDARVGATSCGLNGRGKLEEECDGGSWVETTNCADPDECTDGAHRTLTNVCGADNRGDIEQACVTGAWTGNICDETTSIHWASVNVEGSEGNGNSEQVSVSGDGRYVAFQSRATNLVTGDTNLGCDIFVHDVETGSTVTVSVSSSGEQGYGHSEYPSISADGRYVAFQSYASNLVSGDTNNTCDVFVHDLQTGNTTRVNVDGAGNQANNISGHPSISADGRYVAFESIATNLVSGGTSGIDHVYLRDLEAGTTTLVSANGAVAGNGPSQSASISGDGTFVVFHSTATNLVNGDTNVWQDVFLYERDSGLTRVSVDTHGGDANAHSEFPRVSANGRYVAFTSFASDLVANDTDYNYDVYVRDLETSTTTRVSVDSTGAQANASSYEVSLSADGRYVTFTSDATNLVPNDSNIHPDVFVHDRQTGSTTRVSLDAVGGQVMGTSFGSRISADGRWLAFASDAANLVSGDANDLNDVFVVPVP